VSSYGYQALQPHQDQVIKAAEQQLDQLRGATKTRAARHRSGNGTAAAKRAR
jgi:hypothetical protein